MGAAADCETIGAGFLGQPVNALTTIGFVIAGVAIIGLRPDRRWIGIGLVATGIGSFLFHGPMPPWSEWAHDVTLIWLVTMVAAIDGPWERLTRLPWLPVLGLAVGVVPVAADPLAFVLTGLALLSVLRRDRSRSTMGSLLLVTAVAVYGRLGATGGPLCEPSSLFQPHAVWHLGSAVAVLWWALPQPAPISGQPAEPLL